VTDAQPLTTAEVARCYLEQVSAHDVEPLQALLADDLVAEVGDDTFGKADWIAALGRLVLALVRYDIRHVLTDGAVAVVVYDFVSDTSAGSVPCVEVLTVADGRIRSIQLVFERLHWPEVMAAVRDRSS
jgi:ketosteroid isomerase-like protein